MNNYSDQKGRRLIDSYRGGAEKLYDLCDYINKKAMKWYALNIEFSNDDVELIKKIQQTMEDMSDIRKRVAEDEDMYDSLDLCYGIYLNKCMDCKGNVKVSKHIHCNQGFTYNIYKCVICGQQFEEHQPNNYEDCLIYFANVYQMFNEMLLSEAFTEEAKIPVRQKLIDVQEKEKEIMDYYKKVSIEHGPLKEVVMASIKTNGELFKELIKLKHHFDKEINEA